MIAEDFGSQRVLATESIAGTTVEVACARWGQKTGEGVASAVRSNVRHSTTQIKPW